MHFVEAAASLPTVLKEYVSHPLFKRSKQSWTNMSNRCHRTSILVWPKKFINGGMCQKGAILPNSLDLVQAQNCQVDLTYA